MQLYEFQVKKIFEEKGISVPRGNLVLTAEDAAKATRELGCPVVVKAQVLVGGRGVAGGIRFADDPEQAREVASEILSGSVRGERPRALLIEEKLTAARELYVGATYDFSRKSPVVIASSRGGQDIELVAKEHPGHVAKRLLDPFEGFQPYMGRQLASEIGLQGKDAVQYANVMNALWRIFERYDAELVEANPLAVVEGRLVALDAKLNIDDKSVFRQQDHLRKIELLPTEVVEGLEYRRSHAKDLGIPTYVEMQGNIGVIADGAGSGMLTLDMVADCGGRTRVYSEMGGEATAQLMENAIEVTSAVKDVEVILINLIGGLNLMDDMANGIVSHLKKRRTKTPIVVRMTGTNEDEGESILKAHGVESFKDLYEAVKKAVALARGS